MYLERKSFQSDLFAMSIALGLFLLFGCNKNDDSPNGIPIAKAGDDRKVEIGSVVQLDASGSVDPDGDTLTYLWSFKSKPEGSDASIIGVGSEQAEFTLDRAGSYELELKVGDGTLEAVAGFTVTNKTPIINIVETSDGIQKLELDNDLALKGEFIVIEGDYFGPDINDVAVTVGDVTYEIKDLNVREGRDFINVLVPENAVSGDLKLTVGNESVTWTKPIRITSFPVESFVDSNSQLEERERSPNPSQTSEYYEIGTHFKPLINGEVIGFSLRLPRGGDINVTLWETESKTSLATGKIDIPLGSQQTFYMVLTDPISLQAGKEYVVTTNYNYWYNYRGASGSNHFPQTFGNIELLSTVTYAGRETAYPDEASEVNYITKGADIIFAADPQ